MIVVSKGLMIFFWLTKWANIAQNNECETPYSVFCTPSVSSWYISLLSFSNSRCCLIVFIVIRFEPVIGCHTHAVLALQTCIRLSVVCIPSSLLYCHFFVCDDLTVCLIIDNWGTFTADTLGHPTDHHSFNHSLIVVDAPDAVVVRIADVNFDIASRLIVKRRNSAWFIKAWFEGGLIDEFVFAVSEPAKNFIAERIHYFYLVVVSVCYNYYVLLRDEMNPKRML